MAEKQDNSAFVVCIRNDDCDDLQRGKVYKALPDERAAAEGYLRIADESGEDYLYPASCFVPLRLSRRAREALFPIG